MKRNIIILILFLVLSAPCYSWAACSGSSPTCTCTYDSTSAQIQTCIDGATAGDTINIGAGSAEWSSQITITKAINLIGAGIASTIITGTFAPENLLSGSTLDADKHLVVINPATPSDNPIIRISGFKFDVSTNSYGIFYTNSSDSTACNRVRIDHCELKAVYRCFQHYGLAFGVLDNCIFYGRMGGGGAATIWSNFGWQPGTVNNLYFEDFVWSTHPSGTELVTSTGGTTAYAYRHGTINIPTGFQVSPMFDQHGNHNCLQGAALGAELYGLNIVGTSVVNTFNFVDQRCGQWMVFNNHISYDSGASQCGVVREEDDDDCGPDVAINLVNEQPLHVYNSYYWNNTDNGSVTNPSVGETLECSLCGETIPTADAHYWASASGVQVSASSPFDGTTGVGWGTLANRPTTCTAATSADYPDTGLGHYRGVGYFATDVGNQGTLYYCTSTDTWEVYYAPFTYPHPLRGYGPSQLGITETGISHGGS